MCSPMALGVAGMGLTLYSGWQQAKSARAQGIAQQNYYNYIAQQKEIEAKEALKRAGIESGLVQTQAKEQGKILKKQQAQFTGAQIAQLASQGVDLSSVVVENISSSTYETQREDELALRYNADLKSWGIMEEGSLKDWKLRTTANEARYAGTYSRWAGKLKERMIWAQTASSMLGSASAFGASGMFSNPATSGGSFSSGAFSSNSGAMITSAPYASTGGGIFAGARTSMRF